jgi:uncharacterized protein
LSTRAIPPQKWRAFFLLIYLALLVGVSKYAFGEWLPPANGGKAVWFYTGLASLLLGNHLVTPYFSKPVDAISYAVASAAALLGAEELAKWSEVEKAAYFTVMIYCLLVLFFSFLAIFTRNSQHGLSERVSRTSALIAATFGNHRAIFGLTMLVATFLFHRDSVSQTYLICAVCIVGVVARPDEIFTGLLGNLQKIWIGAFAPSSFGEIAGIQTPNIYLVRQNENRAVLFGSPVAIKIAGQSTFAAIALDWVGRDESNLLRCIDVHALTSGITVDPSFATMVDETVALIETDSNATSPLTQASAVCKNRLVGLVAQDTSNERLYFEVVTTQELLQGLLVQVKVQGSVVIYQILDGLTKDEIVHQKNTFGIVKAQAKKIGIWKAEDAKFTPSKWLPFLNEPVFLAEQSSRVMDMNSVGYFPGGAYPVQLANINHLVTHNTAILGILGVGKTMLAIELVERMMAQGIKVVCLDLTDQYASELTSYYDKPSEDAKLAVMLARVNAASGSVKDNPEQGGSIPVLEQELDTDIRDFLKGSSLLKIYNPARITATKQTTEPKSYQEAGKWNRSAPLWSVTPVEVTRIVSQAVLSILQEEGMSDRAKICLIYEEAHSLVPEWNAVAFDGDKAATAGTARAILQGRKYGMGCLLITQRTANVTKTILNQCNTIFAMRTFDDTGKEFLSNYVGREYAETLSSLPERQAVFFGRASSCENPVLISLNDRDKFREVFRAKFPPPNHAATTLVASALDTKSDATPSSAAPGSGFDDMDDDIPF